MQCTNCKGKKVFKNQKCWCLDGKKDKKPLANCKMCGGTGKFDSTCPYCNGSGQMPDMYTLTFVNSDNGKIVQRVLDLNNLPILRKTDSPNPYKTRLSHICRYELLLNELLDEVMIELGCSRQSHFLYFDNSPIEEWADFGSLMVWDSGYVQYKREPSEKEVEAVERSVIASHFGWKIGQGSSLIWEFRKRQTTEELLDKLYALVSSRGYSYEFRVTEGNIATGESGWGVWLVSKDGKERYAELAIAYTFDVALQSAIDYVQKDIDELDQRVKK
ncbi:MAG: hypothetical protein A3A80_00940 [Candidatus Terrybacteria bacterium RIFCSPLOWO2_01_FULL_44_24]|uniref:Uncharacterized protein n=1 Tax=Candidatus Terrybacteria bacterium RIFCSPHIGHO2_01_FULL_43_35 TaxID=1802361 RepID=A0A1G2PHN7_9BACT|nr:MAG: hypothetical protein A2828_04180 [Candidatus Terrybacteria bacterium RIFCSPHIGHO2_01_FULL_43_35]OHA49873.1 MAG: hypothetical protein A3B75_03120 [Candidatus Terrybacteria bacterium RIFCSPHIGHO2_02_FULL_43_14]OHA50708.1 MAG: hypothetical protein A3A80_00940 [Candidatus Terrybacteria bacterium RIFCSPLOWO2_01_FULL_44_24]